MFRAILSSAIFLFFNAFAVAGELVDLSDLSDLKRAYFLEDTTTEQVSVQLIIHTGEYDLDGPEGLAHYLEHLVFADAGDAEPAERHANASTTGTYTRYWAVGTPDQLSSMLGKMARVFEVPSVTQTYAVEEIDIIEREYQLRFGNEPLAKISADLIAQLYAGQGQARSVIGSPTQHALYTPQAAYEIHQTYYTFGNASLLVTGNINENEVRHLVSEYFLPTSDENTLSPTSSAAHPKTISREVLTIVEPTLSVSRLVYFKDIELSQDMTFEASEAAFDLLHAILDSTLEGGIAKPLRFDNFIVAGYDLDLTQSQDGRVLLSFIARPDRGVTPERVLEVFEATLKTIASNGIPIATFERVKNNKLAFFDSIADEEDFATNMALTGLLADQDPLIPSLYIDQIANISIEDLNAIVNAIASANNVVAALVSPNN